jgi:hypothetical protein
MNPNLIVLSRPTYVGAGGTSQATPAATYAFFSRDYKPPDQERYMDYDIVKNQNGKFKWIYDNGPGFKTWNPFTLVLEDSFQNVLGYSATQQLANLRTIWEHQGTLGMRSPDGTFNIHWAKEALENGWRAFPHEVGEETKYEVVVQFEEM